MLPKNSGRTAKKDKLQHALVMLDMATQTQANGLRQSLWTETTHALTMCLEIQRLVFRSHASVMVEQGKTP